MNLLYLQYFSLFDNLIYIIVLISFFIRIYPMPNFVKFGYFLMYFMIKSMSSE